MHVIDVRNVCEALPRGVAYLVACGRMEETRNGPALVSPCPVTTIYRQPRERVLLSSVRDANPFFHLAEALWMLCGRDDVGFLNLFVRDFGARFSDDGVVHGAYGHRWRRALGFDQLDHVSDLLKRDPSSRQAVIQMWDASPRHEVMQDSCGVGTASVDHIYAGSDDLRGTWKDRPCNTGIFLRVRSEMRLNPTHVSVGPLGLETGGTLEALSVLDMEVVCRSNDIVLGAYGANAVHFSVLQEYLAARIGVEVGSLWQMSWNYHMYDSELRRLTKRAEEQRGRITTVAHNLHRNDYTRDTVPLRPVPERLVDHVESFDRECALLLHLHEHDMNWDRPDNHGVHASVEDMRNRFLAETAWPMLTAHGWHRAGNAAAAVDWARHVHASDWRLAAVQWLERRVK